MAWFIDQKPDDFVDGRPVLRVSIGGNEQDGYYIVYRGRAKKIQKLLQQASANFDQMLKSAGLEGEDAPA